ncbi:MAG: GTP-binding protein [Psychrobacter sp.]|nr:GTP-binding protein [Psychrobacter sp.]
MKSSILIQNVPCTLVTGFLGSGKTTLINQLLANRAADERWALLINEFGRIGIDGTILNNTHDKNHHDIAIREVSGGCICCTSQLPLQIALTRLLAEHRPNRLVIEPTGLAHPHELVMQLSAPHWQTALSMQAVITVLSARQWQQEKYRHNDGFQAHVHAADVVVINRYEALNESLHKELQQWIATLNPQAKLIWAIADGDASNEDTASFIDQLSSYLYQLSIVIAAQQAKSASQFRVSLSPFKSLTAPTSMTTTENIDLHADEVIELPYRYHDKQQGMLLAGWRLPPQWVFTADQLQQWLLALPNWQRIKGVVNTPEGWLQFNFTPDTLTMTDASEQIDSRLEIILLSEQHDDNSQDSQNTQVQSGNWALWDRELMALVTQ